MSLHLAYFRELALMACQAHLRAETEQSRRLALATLLVDTAVRLSSDILRTRLLVALGELDHAAAHVEQLWDEQPSGTMDEDVVEQLVSSISWVEHSSPVLYPHWLYGIPGIGMPS